MKIKQVLNKFKRKVMYHIGQREFTYECEMNSYIPDDFMDSNYCLYILGDKRYTKEGESYYKFLLTTISQEYDI